MGIQGLNKLISNYPANLLENIVLRNTNLVIDGSELVYELYEKCKRDDARLFAEYTKFRDVICQFFECLKKSSIKAYVIFDGFKAENNIERYLKKRSERLDAVRNVVEGISDECSLKPLLGRKVLMDTLSENGIPFIALQGDSDAHTAAIANKLNAPVLSTDTDFCIFPLKIGFIPLREFSWKKVGSSSECKGRIFRQNVLLKTFGISHGALCFLEPLMSIQDGLPDIPFFQFVKSIRIHIPENLRGLRWKRPNRIENLLLWLAQNHQSDVHVMNQISRTIRFRLPRNRITELLDIYRSLPDVTSQLENLDSGMHFDSTDTTRLLNRSEIGMPSRFLAAVADDSSKRSAHQITIPIRTAFYQIAIFRSHLMDKDPLGSLENPRIMEMDRKGRKYAACAISFPMDDEKKEPLHLELADKESLHQTENCEDILRERKQYIRNLMTGEAKDHVVKQLDDVGSDLELLGLTFLYWFKNSKNKLPGMNRALAFTFVSSYLAANENNSIISRRQGVFDKRALHCSTEWECIVDEAMLLNTILGQPIEEFPIGRTFSGDLFQKSFDFFSENHDMTDEDVVDRCFGGSEEARSLFVSLIRLSK